MDPTQLIFLAIVFRFLGKICLRHGTLSDERRDWSRRVGFLVCLCVTVHGVIAFVPDGDLADHYFVLGFRAWMALMFAEGSCAVVLSLFLWTRPLMSASTGFAWFRGPALRRARRRYDTTCASLRAAGLDQDELELALLAARQDYLRRIQGLTK